MRDPVLYRSMGTIQFMRTLDTERITRLLYMINISAINDIQCSYYQMGI